VSAFGALPITLHPPLMAMRTLISMDMYSTVHVVVGRRLSVHCLVVYHDCERHNACRVMHTVPCDTCCVMRAMMRVMIFSCCGVYVGGAVIYCPRQSL
jgi:hypothetical protein